MKVAFLFVAALLLAVALAMMLRPLTRRFSGSRRSASRRALNTAIYRDQLAELERDRAAGSLGAADFDQAQAELQRRMLQDVQQDVEPEAAPGHWRTATAVLISVPIMAALLYTWLGTPAALDAPASMAQQQTGQHDITSGEFDQMVAQLAARLEKNPDDVQGWIMLARSYKATRHFAEAERAFARIGPTLDRDPILLAQYADLLAVLANGNLEGKPLALVERALSLDPDNNMALALAGTAAYERRDFATAGRYWDRLYKLLPPDSDEAKAVAASLAEIRANGGAPGPVPESALQPKPAAPTTSAQTVSGKAALAPAFKDKVQAGDTVFVFARAPSGVRMPLAVLRARAGDLPLDFVLDDSMAINPDMKLSGAREVKLEALVSRSGSATPQAGDLAGESAAVKLGAKNVRIVIDRSIP